MFRVRPIIGMVTVLIFAALACAGPALPSASAPDSSQSNGGVAGDTPAAESPQVTAAPNAQPANLAGQHVNFKSGDLTLEGYLFKPAGDGPFPLMIWNHGNEQNPSPDREFGSVASIFVPAGYVVFAPVRRGQGNSEGDYISDVVSADLKKNGKGSAEKLFVQLITGEQVDDQLAGLAYAKSLPYIDQARIAVVGCSYGGMQALFGAERGAYKAAIAVSPGAESWDGHTLLQVRLLQAVDKINVPVLLIHPEKDASVGPGYALGPEFQKLGKPYGLFIYPPYGTEDQQGHCFGGGQGKDIWAAAALQFLSNVMP